METESLTAVTTRSLFFRNTDPNHNGARLEAGSMVTVKENRRGQLIARTRLGGWAWGKCIVSPADIDCP